MNLQFYSQTLKGDQLVNQDAMAHCIGNDRAFFVVADGLGGHQGGEIISQTFCDSLLNIAPEYKAAILKTGKSALIDWINQTIGVMNEKLIQIQCSPQAHTTCAILWIDPNQVITAHIGDSRIYRFNSNKRLWRTRDHSVPQMLLDEGEISEEEMGAHPDQNRLTRSIKCSNSDLPTVKTYPGLALGDTFILCTDGFWSQSKVQELITLSAAKASEKNLIGQANLAINRANRKSDNVTWQWIRNKIPN